MKFEQPPMQPEGNDADKDKEAEARQFYLIKQKIDAVDLNDIDKLSDWYEEEFRDLVSKGGSYNIKQMGAQLSCCVAKSKSIELHLHDIENDFSVKNDEEENKKMHKLSSSYDPGNCNITSFMGLPIFKYYEDEHGEQGSLYEWDDTNFKAAMQKFLESLENKKKQSLEGAN